MKPSEKTFFLEASLSGLAKWLRFMGIKTEISDRKITLEEIQRNKDKFFLITSQETAQILEKMNLNYLLLPRGELKTQLLYVIHKLDLSTNLTLNLCSLCGEKLIPVDKELFKEKIPPKVFEKYREYNYCPKCDKLYWQGDHIKRLKKKFKKLLSFTFQDS